MITISKLPNKNHNKEVGAHFLCQMWMSGLNLSLLFEINSTNGGLLMTLHRQEKKPNNLKMTQ